MTLRPGVCTVWGAPKHADLAGARQAGSGVSQPRVPLVPLGSGLCIRPRKPPGCRRAGRPGAGLSHVTAQHPTPPQGGHGGVKPSDEQRPSDGDSAPGTPGEFFPKIQEPSSSRAPFPCQKPGRWRSPSRLWVW